MSSAMLNAMGVGSKGKNDVDYSKKYNDSLKELQSLINKKGYKDIKAEELIDYYIANKNNEQQAKVIKGAEKAAQEHPVIMQAARTLTSPLRAQANIANTIDMAVNGKSSINGTADFITNAAYGTRKGLEDKAANDGLINLAGKKIGPISVNKNNEIEILGNNMGNVNAALYDNIDQMAENVYNSLLFGGGITGGITASGKAEKAKQALINGVFSTAAMGDDMSSQLASGSSSGETIKSSVKGALINFLTEMVGAPLEWADVKGSSTFGKILVSGLNEGTEEIIGNVVDRTYDQITQGQLSELSQLKRSYLEQGLSEQEADKEVVKSMLAEDIFAALQAGFAGAIMSGSEIAPNNIIESVQNNIDNKKLGAEAKAQSNSDIQAIIDEGLSKNKNSKAYKYAEELQAKVKTSQANGDVLAGASIYDEADYSKINEKRLGQLQTEIVKEGFKENIATAIEGEKNEDRINKAISKMVNGFELSRYDVKAIKDSEKAINAINEQFGSNFTEKDISNDSLEALSAKLKNGYTDYSFTYGGYGKYQQRAENAQNAVLEEKAPNVLDYTQKPAETFTAEQQSGNPKYNVNAVAITADGNQAAVKIYGKHPFEVSADRSNFKVKTSAGDIDYNNISFENQTQQVLTNEIINKNFGNSGANAVYVNFDPNNLKGASVNTYVSQAKMLYDLGVAKPDVPFNEFVMRNPAFYPAVKFLGDKAINIYRSGQTDAKSYDAYIEEQRKNKKSPTKATRHIEGEYKNISDSDSTIDDVFTEVARKTRVDIERHSDGRQGGNGQFIPSLAKIIINADGSGEYNALIHELGEFGLAYNEQEYKNVQSAIRDWYVSYKGADNFNALVDAYIDTYTKAEGSKTRAEAIDELTNDAVSGLFSTDEGVEQFAKWLSDNKTEAEKKSIIETIADFLKSVIEKIKSVIATSNLQTAARNAMEMEQKRADHIRKQFLNMLDNASNNLYNGTEVEENTKNSVTLGKFADVDINSNEKLEKYGIPNTARTLNDFVYIQKKVLTALNNENFFNQNNKNIVVNADTDIVVAITKDGIRETLSSGKRYFSLPRKIKTAKIAVIDNLPDMIRYAEVVNENEKNYYSKEGSSFLVLSHPAIVDGENYNVEIKIRKTPVENKFYIHNMTLQNKNETVALNTKDKISRGLNSNELSRTDNIANNASNVNNNETKFSLDVDRFSNDLRNAQLYQYNGYELFSKAKELYQRYQSGIANENNFYVNTLADFKEISKRPKGKPDYVSYYFDKTGKRKISSEYWYNENGVVRGSDHWGEGISSCDWYLDGKARKGYKRYGEARWEEFTLQTKTVQYDGKEFLTAFDNSYGKNSLGKPIYKIGDDYINWIKYLKKYTKVENVDIPGTDTKFSLDVDSDGNKLTQQQAEYFKNSKVRDEDGNLLKVYHGTSESFTVFDKTKGRANMDIQGMFFSPWELDAKGYGENVNAYYINITNPASEQMGYKALRKFQGQNNTGVKAREYLENLGYDGVNNGDEEYIVFNSNQIKLADNLTPTENEDIRLSRDVDYAEYAELKRENKHLKEINEVLKHQFELTNGREVSTNSLLKAARKIIKLTPTRMTGADVEKEMKSWHTLDTSQQFFNAAYDLAQKLVENEKQLKYQPTQEEQEMLDYLKNTEIKLSDKQKEEVSYYFGSYGKYKNAARGKINITENGILLDDLANEMEELFGGLMPSDNSQDLPIALLDMVNTYKNKVIENVYGYSKEEYLESLANDILSYYFKTNLYETKADKNEKRFLKARSKYAQQISNYQKLLADEKAKHKKEFSEFRKEQVHKNQQYRSDLYRDTIQYKAEFRKNFKEEKLKAEYRKRIKRNLLRLASLAKQTKTKHIPNNMVESVRDLCYTVTTDTKFDDKILDKVKNLNDSFTRLSADKTDTYHYITNLYNEWLMKDLAALENSIGNKTVAMLNSTELSKLDDIISMTLTTIGKANKLFGYERNKTIEKSVSKVKEEIESISVKQINNRYLRSLGYNSMKPEYFFEYLGSDELLKLYRDVRKGEDTWAVTISDSKNFANDIREKYNWKSWNFDKITEYKSLLGEKLKFDLQDLMSLYAFSRREQAKNHILHGGIKFADTKNKKKSNEYSTHKLSKQDLKYLTDLLTEEQKAYVRDMVKYLSTDMAEKGNEVTRQLYDVELFKEENYFPMKVDGDSVKEKSTEVKGTKKIKNSGMTNATVEGAKQALILNGFDSVWAGHVDEMAKYHAFTLPLENFDKVYNYSDIDDSDNLTSIKEKIENNYGNEAISYISKLIENINGGVVREPGTDISDKLVGLFKKNAVFASASVAIQQPSAIGRALSIIDTKYFAKTTFTKRSYDEIKKYAPVAIIKEMGYFDTNMAQSTVDYINNVDYKGKEKIAAFFKDGAFRDEVFGYTASKADEITWSHIWNACKAEAKDKYPNLSTEESLQKAGERFTEVITKTQVYDSVFSRSALMRSKNGAVKMATAFMAEPTTSLNMLVNATVQAKRGKFSKKKATRIVASLVIASVINALLQSIVTAARNDDDDKTYAEKYIAELIPNFIDNANPVNQIAFLKDAISVLQGYDVTRADMSVVSDLYNSIHNLNSDNLTYTQKIESLAGSIGAFFGLPIKNVIRDINSVENVVKGAKNGNSFNLSMAKEAAQSEIKEALLTDDVLAVFGLDLFPEKDKQQMIYEAIKNGDKEMYKRIAKNLDKPEIYIKKGLIENDERVATAGLAYLDGDIGTAINTAKELESDGFDYELAYKAIKAYSSEIQKAAGYKADSDDKKYKQSLETLISSGTDEETVEKAIDTVEIDEKQDSKDSKLYNKTDLINALNSGDKSVLKTVIDGNIATDIRNGKTKAEAEKSIKSSLKSACKEEYLAADNSKRSQIKTKLESTGYFDDEDFTNWEASSYNTEAMVEAFKSNDTKSIRDYVDNRIKAKVANGMTQDNAVFGIRTSIANQYKAKFINGNADEKAKIITIMTKTGLYGNRTDVINYINKYWLK